MPRSSSGKTYLDAFREQTHIVPKEELRAVWVVRHALISQDQIDRAIDYAVRARFHLIFAQVRGRGDAYYRSDIEPAASDLERAVESFDPLAYLLKRAHQAGIAVHAWINVCYVWSDPERSPPANHIVQLHPDWLMADSDGTRMDEMPVESWKQRGLEGYYVSPGNPAMRKHTVEVIEDIVTRYPVDGVHLDYIRYPGLDFDFSESQRTAFALRYGLDPMLVQTNPERVATLLGEDGPFLVDSLGVQWRIDQVGTLVRMVRNAIGELPLSAAVIPNFDRAKMEKGQDWVDWVANGDVDFVVPMAYSYEPADLTRSVQMIKRAIGSERFLIGLPVFDGRSQYLGYSVSLLRQEGILGYSLFSYNVLVEERFSLEFLERVFIEVFQPKPESDEETIEEPIDEE
ncbi:MAG: family 10 glycosylhydrolase [Candidatus Krumholzibacteria bacterium]|nr:family 10 glycosylhydrolase [Candidatus Krumholzibacteria bacterium]